MNHDEYIQIQVEKYGRVKNNWKYRVGERKAIDWFFSDVPKNKRVLDLGCGIGTGIEHLLDSGYANVVGIDLHPKKIALARRKNLPVFQRDVFTFEFSSFDVDSILKEVSL